MSISWLVGSLDWILVQLCLSAAFDDCLILLMSSPAALGLLIGVLLAYLFVVLDHDRNPWNRQ